MCQQVAAYDNYNEITDNSFTEAELEAAIKRFGNGVSFDGLPGKVL